MFSPDRQPEYFKKSRLSPTPDDRVWIKTTESPRYTLPLEVMYSGYGAFGPDKDYTQLYTTYLQIVLVTAGEMLFSQRGKEVVVSAGEVCLIDKGAAYRFLTGSAGFYDTRYVAFTGSLADGLAECTGLWSNPSLRLDSPARFAKVKSLLKEINRLMGDPRADRDHDVSIAIYALVTEISRASTSRPCPAAIVKILELFENSLDRFVTTREVSHAASLSIMQVNRLFARHFSLPPLKYFAHLKMQHARSLLLTTGLSVKEIAARMGYADQFAFSAQFRKVIGASPREVRKRRAP